MLQQQNECPPKKGWKRRWRQMLKERADRKLKQQGIAQLKKASGIKGRLGEFECIGRFNEILQYSRIIKRKEKVEVAIYNNVKMTGIASFSFNDREVRINSFKLIDNKIIYNAVFSCLLAEIVFKEIQKIKGDNSLTILFPREHQSLTFIFINKDFKIAVID